MSKKMQDIVCIALTFVITSVLVFTLSWLAFAFINNGTELTRDDRFFIVTVMAGYYVLGAWWFCPLVGFFLSDAIEEKWKD